MSRGLYKKPAPLPEPKHPVQTGILTFFRKPAEWQIGKSTCPRCGSPRFTPHAPVEIFRPDTKMTFHAECYECLICGANVQVWWQTDENIPF